MMPAVEKRSMSFELSNSQHIKKTELMAAAVESYATLCDEINNLNATMTAGRRAIGAAQRRYFYALRQLRVFTSKIADTHRRDLPSLASSETEKFEAVAFWVRAYQSFQPIHDKVVLPRNVRFPSERYLTKFEELPDRP
ncbi:hypothetical protein [Acidisoma sp. S159]|jgi:hypothetical protein|uniref:hypothetical protein n=1 Tax=Acidisoma sp. S159 TaxID=1747225 RepID=UPI00131C3D3D|nr:hypothetical protein [Acidisoma sp. S159]